MTAETTSAETASQSDTLGPVTTGNHYLRLWRGVPRELGFLLPTLPIVVVGFSVLITLFSAGVGTLIVYVGLFLLIAALFVARSFGTLELVRLRAAGRSEITPPQWIRPQASGFWRRFFTPLVNGRYWLYLLHGMVVNFAIGIITWSIAITWMATSLGGLTFWFWDRFIPQSDRGDIYVSQFFHDVFFPGTTMPFAGALGDNLLNLVVGVIFLGTLPYVTRGLVGLHDVVARGMLGAWRWEALEQQVVDLSESRGAAISAEGHSLRRLERDIHDGPQQRLVRLQMDIAAAERQLETSPDAARELLAGAMTQSREALEELRALSRGFAPPILLDRGLVAALESFAARSAISVVVESSLTTDDVLPQEIERNAYFVASELVTNAVKHSSGSSIVVRLAGREGWLNVVVSDDGSGGAAPVAGHGLAGLDERLRGLGGTLELSSPAGGPTVASARLPLRG